MKHLKYLFVGLIGITLIIAVLAAIAALFYFYPHVLGAVIVLAFAWFFGMIFCGGEGW